MKRTVRALAVTCAVAGAGMLISGSAAGQPWRDSFEVAVLAVPTAAHPSDDVREVHINSARAEEVRVAAAANAPLGCDGCTGRAGSLQVIHAGHAGRVVARNVAAAWTSGCADCRGWAVSMQVVVADSAVRMRADNRALALAGSCSRRDASAAALQFVVVGADARGLSGSTLVELKLLVDELLVDLQEAAVNTAARAPAGLAPHARDAVRATSARIADLLGTELEGRVITRVRVSRD